MDLVQSRNGVPVRLTEERWIHIEIDNIVQFVPQLLSLPFKRIWYSYDQEADVLYLNFKKPSHADDSELTDDDLIVRYEKGELVGVTVLHASKRRAAP